MSTNPSPYPPSGGGGGMTNPMTTAGDMIDATAGGTPARLPVGSAGQAIVVSSGAPAWGSIGYAGGGTNAATQAAAQANMSPMSTAGDLTIEDATPKPVRLAIGSTAQALTVQSGLPAWGGTINMGSTKITNLTNGSGAQDAAAFGQILPKAGGTMTGFLAPAFNTITFVGGGTSLVDASLGNAFALTLTASTTTLGNPSNSVDGQVIRVRVIQGGAGSFTLAYAGNYDFGAAGSPTLSTAAGKVDILGFEYVSSLGKWCYLGSGLGF